MNVSRGQFGPALGSGAVYVNGSLDALEDWIRCLTRRNVVRYMEEIMIASREAVWPAPP